MHTTTLKYGIAALGTLLTGLSQAAGTVTQRIEPASIHVGEAARLIVSESGDASGAVTAPSVPGLEFVAVSQSQRTESINGVTTASSSVTYQVIPERAGVFTIPGAAPGEQPLTLTVDAGASGGAAQGNLGPRSGAITGSSMPPAAATRGSADGPAFVRLRLAKHELYVGETEPVDIQVGMRNGMVAALNGPPTLNGDAFTLNKLSAEPTRSEELIDGKPFTILTWHSALAAVKPGRLSLTMETPLTVRLRTAQRPDADLLADAGLGSLLNDPMFQNFFGTTTEKEVTVASAPTTFAVLALPTQNQPADFSGAVGHFALSAGLSEDKAAVGDPLTLHIRISGEGNFDRVNAPVLRQMPDWKEYTPTAVFKAADAVGYRGEKTFDQPLIATRAGAEAVPEVSFSWFDPTTRRYEVAHAAPMTVSITPALGTGSVASVSTIAPPRPATSSAVAADQPNGLRADHDTGPGTQTLMPHYYQARYLAVPSLLVLALSGSGLFLQRRERERARTAVRDASPAVAPYLKLMEEARIAQDVVLFLKSARAGLQVALAARWQCPPAAVTEHSIEARLGIGNGVTRIFRLADEAAFSGMTPDAFNFTHWNPVIKRYLNGEELS